MTLCLECDQPVVRAQDAADLADRRAILLGHPPRYAVHTVCERATRRHGPQPETPFRRAVLPSRSRRMAGGSR